MTVHADELLSQQRDEPLGPAEDLFVRHHVAECQECRAFAREVESADRLLRDREPYIAVPPLRLPRTDGVDRRATFAAVAVVFLVLGVVVGRTLGDLRTAEQDVGSAAPTPLGASLGGVRAGLPWSVALGDSSAVVLAKLGEPERRVAQDRQWVYAHSVVVFFDAPASSGGSVWRITALPVSGASTEEGFRIRAGGAVELFREAYMDHEVFENYLGDPPTMPIGSRPSYVVLSVTGHDRAGDEVTVGASITTDGSSDLLQIFRGRPEQVRAAMAGQVLDPEAVSVCEVLVRAAAIAGYEPPGVVAASTDPPPLKVRHCLYIPVDRSRSDGIGPDLDLVSQPIGPTDVPEILAMYGPPGAFGEWRSTGPGQWLLPTREVGPGDQRAWVAILMEPYLFIVMESDEETARRLAAAVRQVIR